MKYLIAAVLCSFVATASWADDSCTARATEKKLAGAAKNSFMKKCENDAKAVCMTQAGEKKLNGAAKNSFVKKCTNDAKG